MLFTCSTWIYISLYIQNTTTDDHLCVTLFFTYKKILNDWFPLGWHGGTVVSVVVQSEQLHLLHLLRTLRVKWHLSFALSLSLPLVDHNQIFRTCLWLCLHNLITHVQVDTYLPNSIYILPNAFLFILYIVLLLVCHISWLILWHIQIFYRFPFVIATIIPVTYSQFLKIMFIVVWTLQFFQWTSPFLNSWKKTNPRFFTFTVEILKGRP